MTPTVMLGCSIIIHSVAVRPTKLVTKTTRIAGATQSPTASNNAAHSWYSWLQWFTALENVSTKTVAYSDFELLRDLVTSPLCHLYCVWLTPFLIQGNYW